MTKKVLEILCLGLHFVGEIEAQSRDEGVRARRWGGAWRAV